MLEWAGLTQARPNKGALPAPTEACGDVMSIYSYIYTATQHLQWSQVHLALTCYKIITQSLNWAVGARKVQHNTASSYNYIATVFAEFEAS